MPTRPSLVEALAREEHRLLHIKRRYYLLKAFQDHLDTARKKKEFVVWNDQMWDTVLDVRTALSLQLTSWVNGMCQDRGFLKGLKSHTKRLYVRKWRPKNRLDSYGGDIAERYRRSAFERLFPDAIPRNRVSQDDVSKLTDRFQAAVARVKNDRNKTLAHLYEHDVDLQRRLLTPRGYGVVFRRLEKLLTDLRMVIDGTQKEFHDLSAADSDSVARDMVDMVLCGTLDNIHMLWGVTEAISACGDRHVFQLRDEYYAGLHRRRGRGRPFNEQ